MYKPVVLHGLQSPVKTFGCKSSRFEVHKKHFKTMCYKYVILIWNIIAKNPHPIGRSLRLGSAAVRFEGLRVRISPAIWLSVSSGFCVIEVCATGRSLVRRNPTECGVSECDCETSKMRRPWSTGGLSSYGDFFPKLTVSKTSVTYY